MGSEWQKTTIGDVAQVIGGGTPSSKTPEYWGEDIPWITPKDLSSHYFRYIERGERSISKLGLQKSSARKLPKNTVLVTSRAPIGYVAIAKNEVTTNQGFKSLILNDDQSPDFFYYLIRHIVPKLEAHSSGSTFKEISGSVMKQIQVVIPPLPEQKAIAHILGTLDDKIELNRRMNATLEGMAKALFKSWFVDFDPVIDNALAAGNPIPDELAPRTEVRRQALANGTANREAAKPFPAAFQQTESMGWIPEGWEAAKLSDLLEVKYGKDHKKLSEGSIPVYGSGGLMRYADKSLYSGESVLIPRKGTLSNILYLNEEFWTVDTMFYTIPKHEHSPKYAFYHLKGLDFASMNVGSAVPSMTTKVLNELPIVMPDDISLKYFDEILATYFDKSEANNKQSQALTKIRDTLLPKLISGELAV